MRDEEEDSESLEDHARASSSRSEFSFINRIRRQAREHAKKLRQSHSSLIPHPSSLLRGIGDDAAILRQSGGLEMVITTDLLVEDVDFRRDAVPAPLLGHKALAVSLSDIAAMGARPRWAMLSIGIPPEVWATGFVDQFYEGFFFLADHYRVTLIGGDVSRTPERIVIDSIVLGETQRGRAVLRAGARPGDHIFVTGALGGAAAGLTLLERGARLAERAKRQERAKHLEKAKRQRLARSLEELVLRQVSPVPRVEWGATLGRERLATAMIDLSDGLSSDLAHLCAESGTGARLEAARIPVDPYVARLCGRRGQDPLLLALHGGEDFELLFTTRPSDLRRLPRSINGVPATYIGDVTNEAGRITLREGSQEWALEPEGFQHFGPAR
jgi:thiamine-monophosphate kinase